MNHRDVLGVAIAVVGYVGLFGSLWWFRRRADARIRQEKRTGRLPMRRVPSAPTERTTGSMLVLVVFALIWVFLPIVAWLFLDRLVRLLTPLEAHEYLPPKAPFSYALRSTVFWWLIWLGFGCLCGLGAWLVSWLSRRFTDPDVSRAEELMKAGRLDEAVNELRAAIDARGSTVQRWNALAEALMRQERWVEALAVSLDIEDRAPLYSVNRRRKALALCKLGLPEVALSGRDRSRTTEERLIEICSYCRALIDWGLCSRAWDQLRRAEVMYGSGTIPELERPRLREQIDTCRLRLTAHFPGKKPGGFDEL